MPKTQSMPVSAKRSRPRGRAHFPDPGPLPVYRGRFGTEQAERLLWRAGFGPRPGEAEALGKRGMRDAVHSLTRPRSSRLVGPPPDVDGKPLEPYDVWGDDVLWWLDRMVRSEAPLVERMTLSFHDWFATSNDQVGSQRLMIAQNWTIRKLGMSSFPRLLRAITTDPAMQIYLSLSGSTKQDPNENYARELQELFTLGVDDGYNEDDVREQARALTGWTNSWDQATGQPVDFHWDRSLWDDGVKVIYGHRGRFDWRGSLELVLGHPDHPRFFVTKLWSYFSAEPLSRRDTAAAVYKYVSSGKQIRPLVEAFLMHPTFHAGERMVKPPIVQLAGMLRAIGRYIDTNAWVWESGEIGQTPFYPPNVSGWDAGAWLNTGTWLGRFNLTAEMIGEQRALDPSKDTVVADAKKMVGAAIDFWGRPTISRPTRGALANYATRAAVTAATADWEREQYPVLAANALRALVVASPDYQTC